MSGQRSERVTLNEVGPRDGLQALDVVVPTEAKVALVEDLLAAGCTSIEVASFVNPKLVPQMADGAEVVRALPRRDGVRYSALVPNLRGLEAALAAGVDRIGVLTSATEGFTRSNLGTSVAGSLERIHGILAEADDTGLEISGYVSVALACPFEGPVEPHVSTHLAAELIAMGCDNVYLGDTIGKGTASSVDRLTDAVLEVVPADRIGVHFHDTYGQGIGNLIVALGKDILKVDAAVAGLGGCPFAPGATGNLATEDVLYLLEGMGFSTGIDLQAVAEVGARFTDRFGLANASRAGRAVVAVGGGER